MTVLEHVGAAASRLVAVGLPMRLAVIDAEVLARHVLGWSRATYLSDRRDLPPEAFGRRYGELLARRERREPVSLITGQVEFWGLNFEVTPDVLTPRPETELLMEEGISLVGRCATPRSHVVDVGTGSGCLAVSLAYELSDVRVTATDISEAALNVARRNAARHGVAHRIAWINTAFLDGIRMTADLLLANLPYVAEGDLKGLPPEVRDFEPREALVAGSDGLELIAGLLSRSGDQLVPGGHLIIEFGTGQAPALQSLVALHRRLELVRVRQDVQGIPRAAVIRCVPDV